MTLDAHDFRSHVYMPMWRCAGRSLRSGRPVSKRKRCPPLGTPLLAYCQMYWMMTSWSSHMIIFFLCSFMGTSWSCFKCFVVTRCDWRVIQMLLVKEVRGLRGQADKVSAECSVYRSQLQALRDALLSAGYKWPIIIQRDLPTNQSGFVDSSSYNLMWPVGESVST